MEITVTFHDDQGNSASVSGSPNITTPDVLSPGPLVFTPDPAPVGTMRTVSTYVTSSTGRPVTAAIAAAGVTFTPVTDPPLPVSAPAGSTAFAWTFTA